jgi:hypothetical protein
MGRNQPQCVLFLILALNAPAFVMARSPIGYDAVLVLMIVELLFAFGVGLACILFSLNIFSALHRSTEDSRGLRVGDLPKPSRGPSPRTHYHAGDVLMERFVSVDAPDYEALIGDTETLDGDEKDITGVDVGSEDRDETTQAMAEPSARSDPGSSGFWSSVQSFIEYLRVW